MADAVLIVGTGAQAKYAIETLRVTGVAVAGLLALPTDHAPKAIGDVAVVGTLSDYASISSQLQHPRVLVATSRNSVKADVVATLTAAGARFARAVHPSATIATTAEIGEGTIVNPQAVVQPFARIGNHVMVHAGVIVEHDCVVHDYANLAPRACLAGHVTVGPRATVFAGAVVLPTVAIGADAVVGAGAVVRTSVADGDTVVGVPARVVTRRSERT